MWGFFFVLPQNSEDRWRFQFSLALVNVLHMGAKLNSPSELCLPEKIIKNKFVLYCGLFYLCTTINQ